MSPAPPPKSFSTVDGQPPRIMIVEDDLVVACDLSDALAGLGYDVVDAVDSGEEAVARARALQPAAILMDIRLAGELDGIQAAARIRSERDVPIVFLSAHSSEETLRRATATEPYGYLVKPYKAAELRCALEVALRNHAVISRLGASRPRRSTDAEIERQVVERTAHLEAANRDLEAFSYSVAHDLRAPLRGIEGFSEILLEDHGPVLGAEGLGHLTRMRGAAQRMTRLLDNLLQLSRAPKTELHRTAVNLSRIARETVERLRTAAPERTVTVDIADALVVSGDEQLLEVLLDNLLGNAWKFTARRAQATIQLGAVRDGAAPAYFVRDDGAGFDASRASALFTPFQRFHPASQFEGTGLGLAIVHRIVERHGGRLWAESAVGAGTTVYFEL